MHSVANFTLSRWTVLIILAVGCVCPSLTNAQVPKEQAWTTLEEGARSSNARNRSIAIHSLGIVKESTDAEGLALRGLSDADANVRASAATALGQMGAKHAVSKLQAAIRKDREASVVLAAASALRKLNDASAYQVYFAVLTGERKSGASLVEEQKKMLNDPKKMAQFGFEQGIGFIPFAGIGYGALKSFTKDDISPVRAAAASALADDPDPKSTQALITATRDKSWIVRAAALEALARRGDPRCVPEMSRAISDEKPEVKYTAAAAVYQLTSKSKRD